MDLTAPFRGSVAAATGALTRGVLTGPRFRRLYPDVHRDAPDRGVVSTAGGLRVTSPTRTAYDLVRRLGLVEGVVALDALTHRYGFGAADIRALRSRHLGAVAAPGSSPQIALMDRRADTPMESRIRVALTLGGIPPSVQHPVSVDGRSFRLDMAYPEAVLAVEVDGEHHRDARFGAWLVLRRPDVLVARPRAELARRAR